MKTIILLHKSGVADFTDHEICSVVELADESILLVDQPPAYGGAPESSPSVVRTDLRDFTTSTRDSDPVSAWENLAQSPSSIWVFDARNLDEQTIGAALKFLRSQIFTLGEPPPAIVHQAEADAHVRMYELLGIEYGRDVRSRRILKQARNDALWSALLYRAMGPLGLRLTKKLTRAQRFLSGIW